MKQIIVDNIVTTYYITEDGQCYNSKTGYFLKGQISNSGYLNFNLSLAPGCKRRLYAHRLVAIAFIPSPEHKLEVNHINGNKLDNRVENLEWVTHAENMKYNTAMGLRYDLKPVYQFDKKKKLIHVYKSISEVSDYEYDANIIAQEVRNLVKNVTLGYYWADNPDNNFNTRDNKNIGKAKRVAQYDKVTSELIKEYDSAAIAAKAVGGVHSHISECCRGKLKSYKNFVWKYID